MEKKFLYEMFIEPFTDGLFMAIIGIITWLFVLGIIGIALYYTLYLIDSIGLKEQQGNGIVIDKWFEPTHTITTTIMVGKVSVPQIQRIPDIWKVKIKINKTTDNVSVGMNKWNEIKINQKINCDYKIGRIYNKLYIKNISW